MSEFSHVLGSNPQTGAIPQVVVDWLAENLPDSGTSGPGVDIQVGGSQPSSGWWLDNGQPLPDTVPPSTPTNLTATATGGSTVNLSWNASTDNIGVTGYHYRIGTGAAVDAGAGTTETVSGLSPLTAYSFQVRAYDAQGNVSGWSTAANATTLDGPDTTAPTPGTLAASAITQSTFTLTVTGASDNIGLHATPYAFSTDNGTTWSAWQAGATYNVTGRSPSTAYQARHKVRDAAGNEATGTAITVTTSAPTPLVADDFNRPDTSAGTLGTTSVGGKTWVEGNATPNWRILSNKARSSISAPTQPAYLTGVSPTPDVRVTAKLSVGSTGLGQLAVLRVRYNQAANDYYGPTLLLLGAGGNHGISMQAYINGVSTGTIDGPAHFVINFGRVLATWEEIDFDLTLKEVSGGTQITMVADGITKSVLHNHATRPQGLDFGIWNSNSGQVDDLAIYPA